MKIRFSSLLFSCCVAMALAGGWRDAGAAVRSFVSSGGNDANPCSLALPCRSFSAAVAQTSVAGEVVVLDSAGYGPVTITQPLSIIAPPGVYAGISVAPSANGVTISTPGVVVSLVGLTIHGGGAVGYRGIYMTDGIRLVVERCEIVRLIYGMELNAANSDVFVNDTTIRDNETGIDVTAPVLLIVDRSRLEGNSLGLSGQNAPIVTVRDSLFARNVGSALWLNGGSLTVSDTTISHNYGAITIGGDVAQTAFLRIVRGMVTDNLDGLYITGYAKAIIENTLIAGTISRGLVVRGGGVIGATSATISGNRISDNAKGIVVELQAELRTLQNNVVDRNALADVESNNGGVITPISGM